MGGGVHVNKVAGDDTAHISQTELASDFFGGQEVDVEGVVFRRLAGFDTVAAVDIDDMHGFGMLNDKVDTVFDGHHFAEGAFDLLGYIEMLEDGLFLIVELDNVAFLGGEAVEVIYNFAVYAL